MKHRWRNLRWRARNLNTEMFLAGLVALAAGLGVRLGDVAEKSATPTLSVVVAVVGFLLIVASLFVKVGDPPGLSGTKEPLQPGLAQDPLSEERETLQATAAALLSALKNPDAMKWNVTQAAKRVDEAFASVRLDGPLGPQARRLLDAGQRRDATLTKTVLDELLDSASD